MYETMESICFHMVKTGKNKDGNEHCFCACRSAYAVTDVKKKLSSELLDCKTGWICEILKAAGKPVIRR